jgi:hypothetical protein
MVPARAGGSLCQHLGKIACNFIPFLEGIRLRDPKQVYRIAVAAYRQVEMRMRVAGLESFAELRATDGNTLAIHIPWWP